MAMLPPGFRPTSSTDATYENSAMPSPARGPQPKHQAPGYKQVAVGIYDNDVHEDAAQSNESLARDWSTSNADGSE
jgi:hypothetical protein